MNKLCLIFNIAPHYRSSIYEKIDSEFDCDWYFSKFPDSGIKCMDVSKLKNVQFYKTIGNPQKIYWQGSILKCLFKRKYQTYLMIAEVRSLSFWIFLLLKVIFFHQKKIYGWSHGWYGRENRMQKFIDTFMLNVMTGMFVYNNHARSIMIEKGIPAEKLFVIGNSLNYQLHKKIRSNLKSSSLYSNYFKNNYPVVLFIGRLTKIKRLDYLLNAIKTLKDREINCNIVLIGTGSEEQYLKSLAKQLQISVWFYGPCYDEKENAQLIYDATICVAPGNIGLTAIHSLSFGTPALTHDSFEYQMPEYEAIIKDKTGSFFKKDDVNSIADTLQNWIENKTDREIIRQACYKEIDVRWNPEFQMNVLRKHLKCN